MSSNTGNKRRGAKARRTSNSPSVYMLSPDLTSFNHSLNKETSQQGRCDTNKRSWTQDPTPTYAEAT